MAIKAEEIIYLIVTLLLKGEEFTLEKMRNIVQELLRGDKVSIYRYNIKDEYLTEQQNQVLTTHVYNDTVEYLTLKEENRFSDFEVSKSMVIDAVLKATPDFESKFHPLLDWISKCPRPQLRYLIRLVVGILCIDSENNINTLVFYDQYKELKGWIQTNCPSLQNILPGTFRCQSYNCEYRETNFYCDYYEDLMPGPAITITPRTESAFDVYGNKPIRSVKKNEDLFNDIISERVTPVYHLKNPEDKDDILIKIRDVAYKEMDDDKKIELIRSLLG